MEITYNQSLRAYNTFRVEARASRLARVTDAESLQLFFRDYADPVFILGGGSNLLFTRDIDLLVLKNEIRGIAIAEESEDTAIVQIGGGESWHAFVCWALDHNLGGVENLSLIPGTVGAAPIQNIGAYGQELREVFHKLRAVELATGELRTFYSADCRFGYRDSIFKRELRGKYFITHVFLRLHKPPHRLNLRYGAITQTLERMGIEHPTIRDLSRAVVRIRNSKLPQPEVLGNSGSFFKNPLASPEKLEALRSHYPDIPSYPAEKGRVKIPAGWLIEKAGWKGYRQGPVGCYEKQALVLVNHGGAAGGQLLALAKRIEASVREQFGIALEREVNVL